MHQTSWLFSPFIRGRILYPTLQRWQALPLLMKIGSRWFGSSCLCWQFLQNYPTHHGPCNEGKEGGNEGHERSEGHDQGSTFGWVGHCYWYEEVRHHQSPQHIDWDRHPGGEEVWQVRSPGLVYDQDSPEGSSREGGVASTWSRHAGNNSRQIPPQSAVVACSASTPAVTSPSSSVWRRSLCVLEFGRTPNLMTVTLFYDFVVWAWTSSEVPVGMSSWASGSPNGVSSDVWCGMLGWDAVTLSKAWQTRKVVTSEKVGLSRSVLDFLGWQSWEPSVVGGGWLAPGLVTC